MPLLGITGNVHFSSYAHWKAHSGLPICVIEPSRGVTAEVLRANTDWKSAF